MNKMKKKNSLWRYLMVRLIVGWILVCILPAFILFSHIIFNNAVEVSLTNSVVASIVAFAVALFVLDEFARFPGQKSLYLIWSILAGVIVLVGLVFMIFRLEYSVYYCILSFVFASIFLFFSQWILRTVTPLVIAYVPIGRGLNLLHIPHVQWVVLPLEKEQEYQHQYQAVVADLSAPEVQNVWAKRLALISIQGTPVYNVLQVQESLTGRIAIRHLYENDLGSLRPSMSYLWIKRCLDIVLILVSLPIVLPIMLITFIAIRLDSEGGAIFTQTRVGLGGKPFTMYKFRSMTVNAENQNTVMTQVNDKRITRVGKMIRKWRIDELPQFWNILKGDMSLIGPRPELPNMVEKLEQEIPFYIYRQLVKPGLSGWAQVTQGGDHVENIAEKLEYDFYYIKNASFTLDLLIVIKTIQTMLTGFGAR